MKLLEKLSQNEVYIIAEMSANHAGSLENALEIVRKAKESGADCIKIQTYTADTLTIKCDNEYFRIDKGLWEGYTLHDLYGEAYTPWEWQATIKEEAERIGLDFLSTPFDKTAVDFLEEIGVGFYKIASFEIVDIPLIEYVASKQKPIIMSCGMASEEEIQRAVDTIKAQGNNDIVLLKCTSEYPASYEDMNVSVITDMMEKFKVPVGLSDHSMGDLVPVVATSLGACVIEKHFCLDRSIKNPDSEFSMEPAEFKLMVERVKQVHKIKGKVVYAPSQKEEKNIVFRKSLFAVKDIAPGEMLTEENVRSIRPGYGLAPMHYKEILGRCATEEIKRGTPLKMEMID